MHVYFHKFRVGNIRIFIHSTICFIFGILIKILHILAKISKKNQNCIEITENLVLGLICVNKLLNWIFWIFWRNITYPTLHCTVTFEHSTDMATFDTYKFYNMINIYRTPSKVGGVF
jgi:hypothetical protein